MKINWSKVIKVPKFFGTIIHCVAKRCPSLPAASSMSTYSLTSAKEKSAALVVNAAD